MAIQKMVLQSPQRARRPMMLDAIDPEACAFLFDEARLQQFRDRLLGLRRRVVQQEAVWTAFVDTYSDLPTGPERRRWLATVLEGLAQQGEIVLPVRHGKQWDRTSAIALPTAITIVALDSSAANKSDWRNYPWHPRLHWVFGLRALMQDQVVFLKRVHSGLVAGWFEQPECFKYRSLQLTGDEKRLEELHRGILFGPERLTLEMLGCEPESLPLASEEFSANPTLLVFENAAPFMLARRVLTGCSCPTIGRLAYGAGKQVLKAVRYLPMVEPPIVEIQYVGDLDAEGIAIAAEFQRLSKSIPVRPATRFHVAMLESAVQLESPGGWPAKDRDPQDDLGVRPGFLASEIREQVCSMIRSSRRIPEEALPFAAMKRLLTEED
jgi:hypothetical protein